MDAFLIIDNKYIDKIDFKNQHTAFVYIPSADKNIAVQQVQLLEKLIVNGIKSTVEANLLIDLEQSKVRFRDIQKRTTLKYCILFGDIESAFGLNFRLPSYQSKVIGEVLFIKADDLSKLEKNPALKTKLWTELKVIFNIA